MGCRQPTAGAVSHAALAFRRCWWAQTGHRSGCARFLPGPPYFMAWFIGLRPRPRRRTRRKRPDGEFPGARSHCDRITPSQRCNSRAPFPDRTRRRVNMGCCDSKEQSDSSGGRTESGAGVPAANQEASLPSAAISQVPHTSVRRAVLNHA
eukprot:scaffold2390_cov57-Phaeocystis_antarctica.AAC.3